MCYVYMDVYVDMYIYSYSFIMLLTLRYMSLFVNRVFIRFIQKHKEYIVPIIYD